MLAKLLAATKFIIGKIITSFFLRLIAIKAKWRAAVPLVQVKANLALRVFLINFSNFSTYGPVVIRSFDKDFITSLKSFLKILCLPYGICFIILQFYLFIEI